MHIKGTDIHHFLVITEIEIGSMYPSYSFMNIIFCTITLHVKFIVLILLVLHIVIIFT